MGVIAWLASTLTGGCQSPEAAWPAHRAFGPGGAQSSALSPDARWVAVGGGRGVTLYAAGALEPTWSYGTSSAVRELSFSPDGLWLAAADDAGALRVLSVADGALRWQQQAPVAAPKVALSATSLAWAGGGQAGLCPLEGGAALPLRGAPADTRALRWSPAGDALAAADGAGGVALWTHPARQPQAVVLPGEPSRGLAWSPDGSSFATVGTGIERWSAEGHPTGRWPVGAGLQGASLAWSPDGERWLMGYSTGGAGLRVVGADAPQRLLAGPLGETSGVAWGPGWWLLHADHPALVREEDGQRVDLPAAGATKALGWSPDGQQLAALNRGQTLVLGWPKGEVQAVLPAAPRFGEAALWAADGTLLAVNSRRVVAWRQGTVAWTLEPPEGVNTLDAVAVHPTRPELLTAWSRRESTLKVVLELTLRDSRDGRVLRALPVGEQGLTAAWRAEFSPDGRWLAVQGGRRVQVYDLERGAEAGHLIGVHGERGGFAWGPGWLASGVGRDVVVWDPATGEVRRTLRGSSPGLGAWVLAVSADGARVAAWMRDRDTDHLELWDARSGGRVGRPQSEALYKGQALGFSPDGAVLAATLGGPGSAGALWLTDSGTGAQLHRLGSDRGWGLALAWTPGGSAVLTDLGEGLVLQHRP